MLFGMVVGVVMVIGVIVAHRQIKKLQATLTAVISAFAHR